jgi:hypothetical protein
MTRAPFSAELVPMLRKLFETLLPATKDLDEGFET